MSEIKKYKIQVNDFPTDLDGTEANSFFSRLVGNGFESRYPQRYSYCSCLSFKGEMVRGKAIIPSSLSLTTYNQEILYTHFSRQSPDNYLNLNFI